MYRYIVTRLLLAVPTLVGAAALVFVLMRLDPGRHLRDPAGRGRRTAIRGRSRPAASLSGWTTR